MGKVKSSKFGLLDKAIRKYSDSIKTRGFRTMKLRNLLKDLGYQKRSEKNIDVITKAFERRNLHIIPSLSLDLNLDHNIHISDFPEHYEGDFFKSESDLENALIEKGTLESIDVRFISNQESPNSSPTRIDIYGEDINDGRKVVVELKKERINGYVSQIFEYVSLVQQHEGSRKVRRILITGIKDRSTIHAINGLNRLEREYLEWYLYKYSEKSGELSLVKVDLYELNRIIEGAWMQKHRSNENIIVQSGLFQDESGRKIDVLGVALEDERDQEMIVYRIKEQTDDNLRLMTKQSFCAEYLKNGVWHRKFKPLKN